MQDILPSNLRKNFSYLALLAMQHYRLAFQNSFSVWTTYEIDPYCCPRRLKRLANHTLTSYLFSIWLVCEYHYTRAECLRLNKFECLLLALTMKKPLPVSYDNGEDHETVFINEILLHERVNELNAPKDQDILTRLLFQSGHFLSNIVLDKDGIPLSFLQRCGWNILGHPVYSFAICTSNTRPSGCKVLIGDASQKEC